MERIPRRRFLQYGAGLGLLAGLEALTPRYLRPQGLASSVAPGVIRGGDGPIDLTIDRTSFEVGGRRATATTINGTVPGPLLRFREGDEAVLRVTNQLDEDTSIHWHGILLPNEMDGVPGVTFEGIRPGETFTYRFPIRQYGTYWYHSHSGLQEQLGHYAPLIIDPADGEPAEFDREHVIVLSDWTFENPYRILARLKKEPDYHNFQQRTVVDFFRDVARDGLLATVGDRLSWGGMRMNATDIADVTGAVYTYLMNGRPSEANWTGLYRPGERVRLRFVNASAATTFDVHVPGLPMTVIQANGQHVRPVEAEELRIGVAERYDVILEPEEEAAYTLFAEAADRSGYARGTLAPREGMEAPIPERRERPLLTMADMGMDHGAMGHEGMDHGGMEDHEGRDPTEMEGHEQHEMEGHENHERAMAAHEGHGTALRPPGTLPEPAEHGPDSHGPGNASAPHTTQSRLHEPGVGLGHDGRRVLVYTDLEALDEKPEFRAPDREIEVHLTGNMERFMWSMDGTKYSDAEPIEVDVGERIRLTLVNDTMMDHPMHLHGVFMELENGRGRDIPLVDTVLVKPAERLSVLFTFEDPGPWAFHCHILYHMEAGMFRVIHAREQGSGSAP